MCKVYKRYLDYCDDMTPDFSYYKPPGCRIIKESKSCFKKTLEDECLFVSTMEDIVQLERFFLTKRPLIEE